MIAGITGLLKEWKDEVSNAIQIDKMYLFGSSIYQNGAMFTPSKSDLDIIVIIPQEIGNAIKRVEWMSILKEKKEALEKKLLFTLNKTETTKEIVSLVPITQLELSFDIHKGETRTFFRNNQFMDIDTLSIFNGKDKFIFKDFDSEFVIQVLKSIQKTRNKYLKNSPSGDYKELQWRGEDILPKEFARESAKIASINEELLENGDELNTSFGTDFIKTNLKKARNITQYSDLYAWIDARSGGRYSKPNKELLEQNDHLLLYEFLYDLTINEISKMEERKKKVSFELKNDFKLFLQDTEILSKAHSSKQTLVLDDIFVSPYLKKSNPSKELIKEVLIEELQKDFFETKKILISGENQSGKTSICKQLFSYFKKNNYIPIYLNDGKNKYLGSLDSKLEKSFMNQYNTEVNFSQLNKENIILIIDDFHLAKNKQKLIVNLNSFNYCIIIVDEVFSINLKNEGFIENYYQYKINEFTPRQRYELIKNWVLLSDNQLSNENQIYQEIDNKTELVNNALGKFIGNGIMPSYPFYVLSFISSYDTLNKPLDNNITSQGYFYQTLIFLYLRKEGVKNDDIDTYINFLSEFSFFIFNSSYKNISSHELNKYILSYREKFNLTVNIEELLTNLQNTNIIHLDDLGNYSFKYSYIYYFFAAKYFADNIQENFKTIENIIKNLHIDEYAYITIFILHHDKNAQVLEEIILNAMTLFEKNKPATLSKEELSFFDNRIDEVIKAVLPPGEVSAEDFRIKELETQDKIEKEKEVNEYNSFEDDEDEGDDEFTIEIRRSIKTVEVMGIIIKNRAGSLKSNQLEMIFKEGMYVHLRILTFFINLIKNEDSQNFIEDFISKRIDQLIHEKEVKKEKKIIDNEKLKKIIQKLFWNINFSIIYNLNSKIIHSLGSNKLTTIIEKVCDTENTPASFIIKHGIFMWYNKNLQIDIIYDKMESEGFSKTTKSIMDHRIVSHCQTHKIGFKEHQKIAQRTKLPSQLLLKRK